MSLLILFISLIHLYFSIKKPIYGFCSLLSIKILIPDTARSIFTSLSLNSFCSIVLIIFFISHLFFKRNYIKCLNNKLVYYIGAYLVFSIVVIVMTDYTPNDVQIHYLLQNFTLQFFPIIVAIGSIQDSKDLDLVLKVFTICFTICTIYGISCFLLKIPYPYNNWFASFYGVARSANYEVIEEMAGIQGRIIGTSTSDSWSFGMVITSAFMISFIINDYIKKKYTLICLILCTISVILTVRRSPIMALMSFYIFLALFYYKNVKKTFIYIVGGFCLIHVLLLFSPILVSFGNIIETSLFFWDDSVAQENDVTGSSFSLRLFQLDYTIKNIANSPLFGNGWGAMYVKYHQGMYGWESIVFTTLFQSGYLGIIALSVLLFSFYEYSVIKAKNKGLAIAFILSSLFFCISNDTIYMFYIYLGCVLLHKINNVKKNASLLEFPHELY